MDEGIKQRSDKKLHVAVIAMGVPSPRYPLHGIFEWDQAKALAAIGVKVDYLAVDLRSFRRFRPWGITHGQKDEVSWHCISIPIGRSSMALRASVGAWALRRLYRTVFEDGNPPDILHAHFEMFGYMAAQLSRMEDIPFVVTEHNSDILELQLSDAFLHILRESHSHASRVIAVSGELKESIYRHTGAIAEVVPNIVSTEFCCERQRHTGTRFVSVGRLIARKRPNVLLLAFAQLCAGHEDAVLEIVGEGELQSHLEELAQELHIEKKVRFHGQLPRPKIAELYRICDCFVLPSGFETFGVVYIEAMASGLPVIATRCGGPEDFVTERNGILVDVDNVEALKEAMMYMYTSHKKYDRKAISEETITRFSSKTIANQLVDIYGSVLYGSATR